MIFDTLSNIEKYKGINKNLDQAIDFICGTDFSDSLEGKTAVCDAFYYTKSAMQTGDITDAPFEAHRRFADIFIPLSGRELVKTAAVDSLIVTYAYQEEDDYCLLEGPAQANVINTPDTFTILFPQDAHNSAGSVDGKVTDLEKIVVKVRV